MRIDSVKNVITTLNVTDSCLRVWLDVYRIRLDLLRTDTLSDSATNYLTSIASNCPSELGEAVLTARSLLSLHTQTRYDRMEDCVSAPIEPRGAKQDESHNKKLHVYPNPATEEVTIELKLSEQEAGIIEIIDMRGNILSAFETDYRKDSFKVETQSFESGIYLIRYSSNSGTNETEKLLITK